MKIAVLGSGYVGLGLSFLWSQRGHFVIAITRSPKKLRILNKVVARSILYQEGIRDERELPILLKTVDAIALTISTDNVSDYENVSLRTAQALKKAALQVHSPRTLIYTSSRIVYGDHKGLWVDESSPLHAKGEQAKILMQSEKILLSLEEIGWTVCVFRCGEIYGPGREISKSIWKLKEHILPGTGNSYTNMVHQEDVLGAINYALTHKLHGIYNLADDDHPTRKELYDKICEQYHLPLIRWNSSRPSLNEGNKRVSNQKIKASGYIFQYPHRVLN